MKILLAAMVIITAVTCNKMHEDTLYNYKQGIGKIHAKFHYIYFSLNLTNLKDTYSEILYSYHSLSLKEELGIQVYYSTKHLSYIRKYIKYYNKLYLKIIEKNVV